METKTSYAPVQTLSGDMSQQLPIFQILGNQLPEKLQTPENKKTMAKILFWLAFFGIGYGLFKAVPTMLALTGKIIMLTIYSFAAVVLLMAFPVAVKLIHRLIEIFGFKADKAITEKYSIETLRLLLRDVENTRAAVHERITHVQSVRVNMITESENQNTEAEQKFSQVIKLTNRAAQSENDAIKAEKDGDIEKSREFKRKASEQRVNATLSKSEGDASKTLAASYAQYANQFGKGLEILKDNESSVRIYVTLLTSSINIAEKKLDATTKMRQATEGLADIFQVEDTAKFRMAMDAVTFKISDNIAHVQRNLEVLSESRLNNIDATKSQEELELFVSQLNSGVIKKLDVQEVSNTYHDLTKEEKVDPWFNILD